LLRKRCAHPSSKLKLIYNYISCIDKRWKIYLKKNLLDEWAVCFLKGKPPEFVRFFDEINIFAILCQLHYLLVLHKTIFRSNWVYFVFSYVSEIWMPWSGYPNQLNDFWRPDDGRNRTWFFTLASCLGCWKYKTYSLILKFIIIITGTVPWCSL
jgi:hypothetical protein